MTDKEMLMLAYGALKAQNYSGCTEVIKLLEKHLFETKPVSIIEPTKSASDI